MKSVSHSCVGAQECDEQQYRVNFKAIQGGKLSYGSVEFLRQLDSLRDQLRADSDAEIEQKLVKGKLAAGLVAIEFVRTYALHVCLKQYLLLDDLIVPSYTNLFVSLRQHVGRLPDFLVTGVAPCEEKLEKKLKKELMEADVERERQYLSFCAGDEWMKPFTSDRKITGATQAAKICSYLLPRLDVVRSRCTFVVHESNPIPSALFLLFDGAYSYPRLLRV